MPTAISCLLAAPLSLPDNLRVLLLKRLTLRASLNGTFPRLRFKFRFPSNKWRFLCNRDKNFSSDVLGSESMEDKLSEDLVTPKCDRSKDFIKDWLSSIRKGTHAVLGVEPWTVPWTAKTIVQVMLLWFTSFRLLGSLIFPYLAYRAGFQEESLTYAGQALYCLFTDVAQGLVGVATLYGCLAKFQPLPSDWFKFRLRGKWLLDVGLGCLAFPLAVRLTKMNCYLVPFVQQFSKKIQYLVALFKQLSIMNRYLPNVPPTPVNIYSVKQSYVARDPAAMAIYAVMITVIAPIWEEIIFRGFLLPSLTKYMPAWCAVLVSSVVFGLAHCNLGKVLPHVFISMVIGVVFVRSGNLLSPMLLHSLWNAFVLRSYLKI